MFGRKKKSINNITYDPKTQKAILRCSICTGEQILGFKDIQTGKFTEVSLIRSGQELEAIKAEYGIEEVSKEY